MVTIQRSRMLLVEDDPAVRVALLGALEVAGFAAVAAVDVIVSVRWLRRCDRPRAEAKGISRGGRREEDACPEGVANSATHSGSCREYRVKGPVRGVHLI